MCQPAGVVGGVDTTRADTRTQGLRPLICLKSGISATRDSNGIWQLK